MTQQEHTDLLDRVAGTIQEEQPGEAREQAASDRVWQRLALVLADQKGCEQFQAWFPEYQSGSLSEDRTLLVRDHLRGCLDCRRVIQPDHGKVSAPADKPAAPLAFYKRPWLAALVAAVVLAVSLVFFTGTSPDTGITLKTGHMLLLKGAEVTALDKGSLPLGQELRTPAKSSNTMVLADGSTIETRSRSRFKLNGGQRGISLELQQGGAMVNTLGGSSLPVVTRHAMITPQEHTSFMVNRGTTGTRVVVISGSVRLDHGGRQVTLNQGQAMTTGSGAKTPALNSDVSWSQHADLYASKLLSSRDLPSGKPLEVHPLSWVPQDSFIYAALPVSQSEDFGFTEDFYSLMNENMVLSQWWKSSDTAEIVRQTEAVLEVPHQLAELIDGDVVITAGMDEEKRFSGVTALIRTSGDLGGLLVDLVERLNQPDTAYPWILLSDSDQAPVASGIYLWLENEVLIASTNAQVPGEVAAYVSEARVNLFENSEFYAKLDASHEEPGAMVMGIDLNRSSVIWQKYGETLEPMGFADATYLILREQDQGSQIYGSAEVSFNQMRRGMASWLAQPAPLGSLDFISPDATLFSAFAVKDPELMLADLTEILAQMPGDAWDNFDRKSLETLHRDLVAHLGGEVALALDGPILPTPSWKLVLEVERANLLLEGIQRTIDDFNTISIRMDWSQEVVNGYTLNTITDLESGADFAFAIEDGYMVIGPTTQLVERTLQHHQRNYSMAAPGRLESLLPGHGYLDVSALFYENLATLGPLAESLGLDTSRPSLAMGFASDQSIRFSTYAPRDPHGLGLTRLLSGGWRFSQPVNH